VAQREKTQRDEESAIETKSNQRLTGPPQIIQFFQSLIGHDVASQLQQNSHQYQKVPGYYSRSLSPFPSSSEPKSAPSPAPVESSSKDEEYHSDNDSSNSDIATPESSTESSPIPSTPDKLHRLISLEEVEDEEFVMFRKKFGQ
jgi:hypothetical protein